MNQQTKRPKPLRLLGTTDHSRDSSGMTYVYPVVSRRAGGVSVGINLNPNNACNWRCIYCQVPSLTRGTAPPIDLQLLERELQAMLQELLDGDFMEIRVPVEARRIVDVAFSGNGEPTSSPEFRRAVDIAVDCLDGAGLLGQVKLRLITNGSFLGRPEVRGGIARLSEANGEVWFKLDAGSKERIRLINNVDLDPARVLSRLRACGALCPTWVQTCCFALDGTAPNEEEIDKWLRVLHESRESLQGVHLYGLARQSFQAESPRLTRLPDAWLDELAVRIACLGLPVRLSP